MAKAPLKRNDSPTKNNGEPLVSNDDEAQTVADALANDTEDLPDIIRDRGWQEAIETLQDLQDGIDALHAYLANKE